MQVFLQKTSVLWHWSSLFPETWHLCIKTHPAKSKWHCVVA